MFILQDPLLVAFPYQDLRHCKLTRQSSKGWWVGAFDTPSVALSLEAEAQHFLTQLVALRASTVHSDRVTFRLPEYRLDF